MISLSIAKPKIEYEIFSCAEWSQYPKIGFDRLIRRWCGRWGFVRHVGWGKEICMKLPYRKKDDNTVEVAKDFIDLAEAYRARRMFTSPIKLDGC